MKKQLAGFVGFVREQGVVGLAIGFILGGAVSKVVASLVSDIINPVLGIILGQGETIKQASLHVGNVEILWGNFIATLIDFLVVALVVYYGVKAIGLNNLDQKKAK